VPVDSAQGGAAQLLAHITRWRPDGPVRTGFDAFLGAVGRKD
jgi:hypothetical protein